jgi:YjjG family noncanonical pyrimidine nucleotidase
MNYKWIFFDADGTLFDYDTAEQAALEGAFDDLGLPFEADTGRLYSEINGRIWRDYELGEITQARLRTERFDRLFDAIGVTADSAQFSREYLAILAEQTALLEGAEEIVSTLAETVRLLLITNGLADVQRPRFAASSIGEFFSEIVISEEVGAAKPDPAIFDFAFTLIGRPPRERVLMVGDNLGSDILGGANYGLDTCWYNPARSSNGHDVAPTYEIRELRGLLEIIAG